MPYETLADVRSLIQSRIEEGLTLEYKEEVDRDSKDIAKDISAFANTEGGTIIYGVKSQDKIAIDLNWLENVGVDERIQNIAMTTIHPRLEEVKVIRIPNPENGSQTVYVVDIPKSPNQPHMVFNRYYIRRGSVSSAMEDAEVKSALFGAGRNAALRYEISKNIDLAKRTHELIERVYVYAPEQRQPFALIPFHTDAWNAIVASGVLYSLGAELSKKLVESYRLIHEVNSLIMWLYHNDTTTVVHTPADVSSSKHGIYIPAVIRDRLPRVWSLLEEISSLLQG